MLYTFKNVILWFCFICLGTCLVIKKMNRILACAKENCLHQQNSPFNSVAHYYVFFLNINISILINRKNVAKVPK